MAAPPRQTRKSLSAIPTPVPSTATSSSSNVTAAAGSSSSRPKAGKRAASFAPGDTVGLGGSRPVAVFGKRDEASASGGLSPRKVARRALVSPFVAQSLASGCGVVWRVTETNGHLRSSSAIRVCLDRSSEETSIGNSFSRSRSELC